MMLFFLTLLMFASCTEQSSTKEVDAPEKTTPKALNDKFEWSDIDGMRLRNYSTNIFDKLYEEALEKDKEISQLNGRINKIRRNNIDSLSAFQDYNNVNQGYFSSANRIASQIVDTTLKASTIALLKDFKSSYEGDIAVFKKTMMDIESRNKMLNDQLILMKILVTQPMIEIFMDNEIPDLNSMKNIRNEFDKLIKDIEAFNKTQE